MHAYEGSQSSFLNSMYRPNSALQPSTQQSYSGYKSQTDYPMAVRFDSHPLHSLSAYNSGSFSFYPCASSHRYVHDLNCSYTAGSLHSGKILFELRGHFFSLALNLNSLDKPATTISEFQVSRDLLSWTALFAKKLVKNYIFGDFTTFGAQHFAKMGEDCREINYARYTRVMMEIRTHFPAEL